MSQADYAVTALHDGFGQTKGAHDIGAEGSERTVPQCADGAASRRGKGDLKRGARRRDPAFSHPDRQLLPLGGKVPVGDVEGIRAIISDDLKRSFQSGSVGLPVDSGDQRDSAVRAPMLKIISLKPGAQSGRLMKIAQINHPVVIFDRTRGN